MAEVDRLMVENTTSAFSDDGTPVPSLAVLARDRFQGNPSGKNDDTGR